MSQQRSTKDTSQHNITSIFVFFLIGLFAVLAVTLTVIGVRAYNRVSAASVNNSNGQVALSYILNKVHAGNGLMSSEEDAESLVQLKNFDGTDVLCLGEKSDWGTYWTYIYYQDGALRECYTSAEEDFTSVKDAGSVICELASIEMVQEKPGLLHITATQPDGESRSLYIALRGEEGTK